MHNLVNTVTKHNILLGLNAGLLFSVPKAHLLQFGERERVAVLGSKLHEPHVGRVCELGDDAEAGKQPECGR